MDTIKEKESATISFYIKDATGTAVPQASIAGFTVTLYNKSTEAVINSRTSVNLYGGGTWAAVTSMKATVDTAGYCTIYIPSADNAIINTTGVDEVHILLVQVTSTGTYPSYINQEIEFTVENLLKVS